VARRRGAKIMLHGNKFLNTKALKVRFTYEQANHQVEATEVVYKNERKVGVVVPDMGDQVPLG
jgi:hypothetical protein